MRQPGQPTRSILEIPLLVVVLTVAMLPGTATAAEPPDRIHYQGVLRDSANNPLDGIYDMVFRFFDAGGNEVLVDAHEALGGLPVAVSGGLFSVDLGAGDVFDGTGPGVYSVLTEVFRDHSAVWVSIEIDGEVLIPRVELASAGYALNADHLDGMDSTSFLTSETDPQVGSTLANRVPRWGGTVLVDGTIYDTGGKIGIGTDAPQAVLDVAGDVRMDGDLHVAGDEITFGVGPTIQANALGLHLLTMGDNFKRITLQSGNDTQDGQIEIRGDSYIELRAGNGYFEFANGNSGSYIASLGPTGDLQIDGNLDIDGQFVDGPPAANFVIGSFSSLHLSGDAHVRTMIDDTNNSTGAEALWYHNGQYNTTNQLAELQEDGDFRIRGTLSQNVAFDVAESFFASEPLEPGDVVRLDPNRAGAVRRSTGAGDSLVLGVISSKPGVLLGSAPFDPASLREVWGDGVAADFEAARNQLRGAVVASYPGVGVRLDTQRTIETTGLAATAEDENMIGPPDVSDRKALSEEEIRTLRAELEDEIESLSLERFFEERFVPVALAGRVPVKVDASVEPIRPGDALSPGPTPGVAIKADGSGPVIGTALEGLQNGRGKLLTFVHRGSNTGSAKIEDVQQRTADLEKRAPDSVTGIQPMTGNLQIVLDTGADQQSRFSIFRDGDGESIGAEVLRVDEQGDLYLKGAVRPMSMDVAEYFPLSAAAEPGDVLVADHQHPGRFRPASLAADRAVVGVVATKPGVLLGSGVEQIAAADPELAAELEQARRLGEADREADIWQALKRRYAQDHAAVALTGTVDVKVDAGYGAIRTGDLLMSSPTPGHAMRADDPAPGTILGKALGPLDAGTGRVRMLVMLR